jgi:Lon protease-like protein
MAPGNTSAGEGSPPQAGRFEAVPLFPLPNVVLFPRAVLPLHIFEERYKTMTADALSGRRRIAMALLRPGWEKDYYGRPEIAPVVCVGDILTHEQLPDGKYNFLLQGISRARVVREFKGKAYRCADLEVLAETNGSDADLADQRRRLNDLLRADVAAFLPGAEQFLQLLAGPLTTASVADLIAFHLLDDVETKQSLLADTDVRRRVVRIIDGLAALHPPPAVPVCRPKFREGYHWN